MTDNEIIKALECCKTTKSLQQCMSCPFYDHDKCVLDMFNEAIDLINRQKEEIKKLKKDCKIEVHIDEAFQKECEYEIKQAGAEAIKEFAEELMFNLDGEISAYSSAGHGLNVYSWLKNYLISKGAIKYD